MNERPEAFGQIALFDDWKIQLLEKLGKLILRNNYVETSGGIYLFKPVLPMGYIISGEGLNSVALSGEVDRLFYSDGVSNECRVKIAEINNYPMELVDYSVEREGAMGCSIRKYKRYVDDSHAIISGSDLMGISDSILAIGYMYGVELVINVDLGIWYSEFLDSFIWRNIGNNNFNTMMKVKKGVPFGHVKRGSDHPKKYKLKSMLGEMLRNRRISSDDEIVDKIDWSIAYGFESIGHTRKEVLKEKKQCIRERITSYIGVLNDPVPAMYFD